jgi:predicted dehydrogenase
MTNRLNPEKPITVAVIGVRGMGPHQARLLSKLPEYRLVAVCDLDPALAASCATDLSVKPYSSMTQLLKEEKPDVVAICTNNTSHAQLTIEAARAGVKAIHCEKPMATSLGDARAMIAACEDAGVYLVINHQRRIGPDLLEARRLIERGAIGTVLECRGYCAGDILSDGTHLVDSLLWLTGDCDAEWVAGHIHRDLSDPIWQPKDGPPNPRPGFRYGHPVESGGMGLVRLKSGTRMELYCGDYQSERAYQEYEIIGTGGRLWRIGDQVRPNLFIQDEKGGDCKMVFDPQRWHHVAVPSGHGPWRAVPRDEPAPGGAICESYRKLARTLRQGEVHPMSARVALRGLEIVMAIYESARLGRRIELPLEQEHFPLELMLEETFATA